MKPAARIVLVLLAAVPGVMLLVGLPRAPRTESAPAPVQAPEPVPADRWAPRHLGFRMTIPPGWSQRATTTRDFLEREAGKPHAGSFNALVLPNLFGKNIEGLHRENVSELERAGAVLERSQSLRIGDKDVLRFDYRAKPTGEDYELRVVCMVWLDGNRQVILTSQVKNDEWEAQRAAIETALGTLVLGAS
jgi:hypothetical protein